MCPGDNMVGPATEVATARGEQPAADREVAPARGEQPAAEVATARGEELAAPAVANQAGEDSGGMKAALRHFAAAAPPRKKLKGVAAPPNLAALQPMGAALPNLAASQPVAMGAALWPADAQLAKHMDSMQN